MERRERRQIRATPARSSAAGEERNLSLAARQLDVVDFPRSSFLGEEERYSRLV